MSLGLPDFASRGRTEQDAPIWRGLRVAGFVALAYSMAVAAMEWRSASQSSGSIERARAEVAQAARSADDVRRSLRKNADLFGATASVESSPARVLSDLNGLLPAGVSVQGVKIEYTSEALARVDMTVVARTPEAYDRFLAALGKSPQFAEIKPGAEVRPGLVRATLTAIHRPKGGAR